MMRDRLPDLNRQTTTNSVTFVSMEGTEPRLPTPELFFAHVHELRDSIDALQQRIETLQLRQNALLSQPVVQPADKAQLEELLDEIRLNIRRLKPRIKQLDEDLRVDEKVNGGAMRGAGWRMRKNQLDNLRAQLSDLILLFNNTQVDYKSKVAKRVKRKLEMTGQHMSFSEIDDMLDSKTEDVFYRQLRPISIDGQVALDDATSRHREILELERSISELRDIFDDMQAMVQMQGGMVDNIEANVAQTRDYVYSANSSLRSANSLKRKANQRLLTTLTVIVLVVAILAIIAVMIGILVAAHGH